MNWEALGCVIAAISLMVVVLQAFTIRRLRQDVSVSGSITTHQQEQLITAERLSSTLVGFVANEKFMKVKEEIEGRIDDVEDQLGNKIDVKFDEVRAEAGRTERNIRTEIQGGYEKAALAANASASKVHSRIDQVSKELATLSGYIEAALKQRRER
ncbi:MAG: hypothetical protein ABSE62_00445 [Chthoniobacteraceae bacterium]|jgi:ElaB/YqjD/DUF883 family membrane-anchored ribosome-binding protein